MKQIPLLFLVFSSLLSYSQNVGIGTNTPHASAALEIKDSTKGILIPRMTMAQRNAIQNPAEGLMVYQTDSTKGFWYFTNTYWNHIQTTNSSINNMLPLGSNKGEMLFWSDSSWKIVTPGTYGQTLAMCDGVPTWGGCPALLTTQFPSPLYSTTIFSGGAITNDGGNLILTRGIVWDTITNPTIALNTKTSDGSGIGTFNSFVTNLTPNKTYYVKAYTINILGTYYGNEISFTTPTKIWDNQNLDVVTYRNGDQIPQVTDPTEWASLTTGAWCWPNNDSVTYAATRGKIYNCYAINDSRGLAPLGWHVASNEEWNDLAYSLGGPNVAGGVMMQSGGWVIGSFCGNIGVFRNSNGGFGIGSSQAYWWCSESQNSTDAKIKRLYNCGNELNSGSINKKYGIPIRCVKD